MKILAEDLARLCYNAIQFSAKDSSLDGVVMFTAGYEMLEVWASDDYVAMTDRVDYPEPQEEAFDFYLGLKEVKELERSLRDKEGVVDLFVNGDVLGYTTDINAYHEDLQIVSEPPDFSEVVEVVHSEGNPLAVDYGATAEPFAIRAERFTKFRLLRTPESPSCKDGYPVDFIFDGRFLRWKCGPFLRGVVAPLARRSFVAGGVEVTGIKDLYAEEEEVLW